jgi:hypothetical protein
LTAQIFAEIERLGLRLDESPYQGFAAGPGGADRFLETLRRLQPGVEIAVVTRPVGTRHLS